MRRFTEILEKRIEDGVRADDMRSIQSIFAEMRTLIRDFTARVFSSRGGAEREKHEELESLQTQQRELHDAFSKYEEQERQLIEQERGLRDQMEKQRESIRESERETYELKSRRTELQSALHGIKARDEELARDKRDFEEELREAAVLVGGAVNEYTEQPIDRQQAFHEPRQRQEERRKSIERIKIRLEDVGGGSGEEIMREYEEVRERDRFLESEVADLRESAESLRRLIVELEEKISAEFRSGIKKINTQFAEFFSLMFGGGSASLAVVREQKRRRKPKDDEELTGDEALAEPEEAEEEEEGVEVNVSLPHKKIRGLSMLSGGERALTSIALLFAVSQVNPPPFLVLDETDAALDEANSRKYGDMLESLSASSQLIVITHNRETMSRAGILYGVTMGADAASKVLSVKFEEAEQLAK